MNHTAYTDDVWTFDENGMAESYNDHDYMQRQEHIIAENKRATERRQRYQDGLPLECVSCGRAYSGDFIQRSVKWWLVNYCSAFCEKTHERLDSVTVGQEFKPAKDDPFDWLVDRAERLYSGVLGALRSANKHGYEFDGVYWRGRQWYETAPFEFANTFFDYAMDSMFATHQERTAFFERLCESANFVKYGANE